MYCLAESAKGKNEGRRVVRESMDEWEMRSKNTRPREVKRGKRERVRSGKERVKKEGRWER